MEFEVGDLGCTGDRFVSLKPRLLKCTHHGIAVYKNNEKWKKQEYYVPVEFLKNYGSSSKISYSAKWTYTKWSWS